MKQDTYQEEFSFGQQLRAYGKAIGKLPDEIADDLSFDAASLRQIMEEAEQPTIELMYQLDKHSQRFFPTRLWYQLHAKQALNVLENNASAKKDQDKLVKRDIGLENLKG